MQLAQDFHGNLLGADGPDKVGAAELPSGASGGGDAGGEAAAGRNRRAVGAGYHCGGAGGGDHGAVVGACRSSRRRFGAWLWIVEQGTECRVWFNGMLAPAGEGRVGLRIHLEKSSVEFRDLRIRSL